MISVVFCTRQDNPAHIEHLKKTSGIAKFIQVIQIINNGESLTSAYNRGLKQANHDVVVFCHDDITIETNNWGNKLTRHFDSNPEYGIIGVAGSKFMAESGRWWEDRRKMYGRVAHTHEGKTWLSSYSEDQGNDLEQVVTVDGVFFAVSKKRLKKEFDENVKGFHFYDVNFSFENHLAGVKVGVFTNIRINHKSIGETNEEWEKNRLDFAELYKGILPVNIKKVFRKNEKIKVLIGCLNFNSFTGSELYVYELAKELIKNGCEVTVCSNIGEPLARMAKQHGIKLAHLQEPPGFKLGDGKWSITTPEGLTPSQPKMLYKISDVNFDILHLNHTPVTEHLLKLYPNVETICSIHSEVISLENPIINPQIKKYIAIRPEIKEHLIQNFGIDGDKIDIVYNPIDYNRFKPSNTTPKTNKRILFVGTIDYLRKQTIQDLINTTELEGNELYIVGKKNDIYLESMIDGKSHVKYFEPTYGIEKFVQQCDETAGILLGRTTIEGWLCGKGGWIYNVDSSGNINSKAFHPVPDDIDKFRADNVAKEIIEKYKEIKD